MKVIFKAECDTPSHKYQPGIEYEMDDARGQEFIDAGLAKEAKKERKKPAPRRKAILPDDGYRKYGDDD